MSYYIGNTPTKNIEDFEAVILGTLKEQRILKNGQIVVETRETTKETPEPLKEFKKYSSNEIENEINKIEGWI